MAASTERNQPVLRVAEELDELLLALRYEKVLLQGKRFHLGHELLVLVEEVLADFAVDLQLDRYHLPLLLLH